MYYARTIIVAVIRKLTSVRGPQFRSSCLPCSFNGPVSLLERNVNLNLIDRRAKDDQFSKSWTEY